MQRILRFSILILAVSLLPLSAAKVWSALVHWDGNDHWYEAVYVSTGINWFTAKAAAEARGGYLATVTSSAENNFVFNLINDMKFWWNEPKGGTLGPWLGGYQYDKLGEPRGH